MNNIKVLREKLKLDQKALAATMGVTQPTISDWETGRKVPSMKNVTKLAHYFNTSTDFLLGNETTNYPLYSKNTTEYIEKFNSFPEMVQSHILRYIDLLSEELFSAGIKTLTFQQEQTLKDYFQDNDLVDKQDSHKNIG